MVSDINGLCDVAVYDISGLYEIAVCVMLQFLTSGTGFLAYHGLYYVMLHNVGNLFLVIWDILRSKTAEVHVTSQFV